MPATSRTVERPDATVRGLWRAALPLIIPPFVWIAALGLSWAIQEFTCSAVVSTGAPVPETALLTALLVVNAVMLLIAAASGLFSIRLLREGRNARAQPMTFIGATGIGFSIFFGIGIVLIGAMPLTLEVC